jgi:hypothetical protein
MVKISLPPEKRLKFFVYIIESPSGPDLYHKRYEGDMLERALSLDSIPCTHHIAIHEEAFRATFLIGLKEAMEKHQDLTPIIHISAHGSSEGIQLSDGTVINWKVLKNLLHPINKALKGNLLICMSSCEGYSACRMAMEKEEGELPFFAIVGNTGKPKWSDTAVAYAVFYHLIKKGCFIVDAVKAMKEASGDDNFRSIMGIEVKKAYLDVIKQEEMKKVKKTFDQEIRKTTPS